MFGNDFTNEEKERINAIYGNDFKDLDPEDVQLVIRWEKAKAYDKAVQDEVSQAAKAAAQAETERCNAEADYYREKLARLAEDAKKRFKEVSSNG